MQKRIHKPHGLRGHDEGCESKTEETCWYREPARTAAVCLCHGKGALKAVSSP